MKKILVHCKLTFRLGQNNLKMKGNQSGLHQEDYFSAIYTNNNLLRYCFIAFAIFSSIFGTLGLYIIVWFEKRSNKQRQTLLNKLAALCLWSCIEFVLVIESTEVARYFYGPLPEKLCFWHQVYRSFFTIEVLLQIDAIIIARYIFIFWLKNPTGFNDGVWFWFIFIWIKLSSRCQFHQHFRCQFFVRKFLGSFSLLREFGLE